MKTILLACMIGTWAAGAMALLEQKSEQKLLAFHKRSKL